MEIEPALRAALSDIAQDAPPSAGMAATVLRRARRRQHVARTAMAGTAAAVAIPVGLAALGDRSADTATDGAAASTGSTDTEDGIVPAPPSHVLDDDALAAAFETCLLEPDAGDTWEPVFGITIASDTEAPSHMPKTWVVARDGDEYLADCALNADGDLLGSGYVNEHVVKRTPGFPYALVDGQDTDGAGRFVEPVARVTVQPPDGPEQAAVTLGGFWFYPMSPGYDMPPEDATSDLIGVPVGWVYRGYSADGELLYDSTTDGPSIKDCYADPTGTEFVGNSAGHSDPSECVRTHRWEPIDLP